MKQKIKMYLVAALCGGCMLALAVLLGYLAAWYIVNFSPARNPSYYVYCGANVLLSLSALVGSYVITRNIIADGI